MLRSPFGWGALSGGAWVDIQAQDVTRQGSGRQDAAQATSIWVDVKMMVPFWVPV